MLNVNWIMSRANTWLSFKHTDLSTVVTDGVYVIWKPGTLLTPPDCIRVGQGRVADRIAAHRQDPEITKHDNGDLLFTFAAVPVLQRDGVERYLGQQLLPKVGLRFPSALVIAVNLPGIA